MGPCWSIELDGCLFGLGGRIQNTEDILLAHYDVLDAVQLGVAAGIFSKEDTVARFDVQAIICRT
jgi:hypothetical protein